MMIILLVALLAVAQWPTGNDAVLFDTLTGAAGGAIGGTWGAVVPGSTNLASIKAACKTGSVKNPCVCRCMDGLSGGGGGLFDMAAGAAGTVIGGAWGAVVPGSANLESIKAACKTGSVRNACVCGCFNGGGGGGIGTNVISGGGGSISTVVWQPPEVDVKVCGDDSADDDWCRGGTIAYKDYDYLFLFFPNGRRRGRAICRQFGAEFVSDVEKPVKDMCGKYLKRAGVASVTLTDDLYVVCRRRRGAKVPTTVIDFSELDIDDPELIGWRQGTGKEANFLVNVFFVPGGDRTSVKVNFCKQMSCEPVSKKTAFIRTCVSDFRTRFSIREEADIPGIVVCRRPKPKDPDDDDVVKPGEEPKKPGGYGTLLVDEKTTPDEVSTDQETEGGGGSNVIKIDGAEYLLIMAMGKVDKLSQETLDGYCETKGMHPVVLGEQPEAVQKVIFKQLKMSYASYGDVAQPKYALCKK